MEPIEGVTPGDYEWQPFTENFDYLKEFYDVMLPDGTVLNHFWPNAGKMNAMHGAPQKQYTHLDNIKVRLSPDHPEDDATPAEKPKMVIVGSGTSDADMVMAREIAAKHGIQVVVDDEAVRRQERKRTLSKLAMIESLAIPFMSPSAGLIQHAINSIPKGRTRHRYGPSYRDQVVAAVSHEEVNSIVNTAEMAGVIGDSLRKLNKAAALRHRQLNGVPS